MLRRAYHMHKTVARVVRWRMIPAYCLLVIVVAADSIRHAGGKDSNTFGRSRGRRVVGVAL